jgi:hypothetical protein
VVAILALEARESGLLAALEPAEERPIRLVQPREHVLQHMAVEGSVLQKRRADILQFGFLLELRDGDLAALPGGDALLQRCVVEHSAAPEHRVQRTLLGRRRTEFLFVGLADGATLLLHMRVSCLIGTGAAMHRDFWRKPARA